MMEYYNFYSTMAPLNGLMSMFMGLLGRMLLAVGLYYMGKALWLTIRRRH